MKNTRTCLGVCLPVLMTACGGGSGSGGPAAVKPTPATKLAYTDPTSGDFRLVKDPASTSDRLVLTLTGPASLSGKGIEFTFKIASPQVSCVKVQDSDPEFIRNGDVFVLDTQPPILKGLYADGQLNTVVAQRGPGKALNGPLARFALQLKPNSGLSAGATLAIGMTEVSYLPASGSAAPVPGVSLGTLTAQ